MKIKSLERHIYAPELNKLHLENGIVIPCPNANTIREARQDLFPKRYNSLLCVVTSTYTNKKYKHLDRLVASGRVKTRLDAYRFAKKYKQKGGELLNGETLPENKLVFKFYY